MKQTVIDKDDLIKLSPVFKGKFGDWLMKVAFRLLAIDKVNWVYGRSCHLQGADFTTGLLNDFQVNYCVGNAERLNNLPKGAFITVSNHPYGGLDGIMLIDLMATFRPDFKVMVNTLLAMIKAMNVNFIAVQPKKSVQPKKGGKESPVTTNTDGIREILTRLKEGHPVGFFPAGGVSMYWLKERIIHDGVWQESAIRLIKKARVPIIPVRFYDRNSAFFYFLGVISWQIRSLRMPHEVFNKKGETHRIGIGQTISVEQQDAISDIKEFGQFLYNATYTMPLAEKCVVKEKLNLQILLQKVR